MSFQVCSLISGSSGNAFLASTPEGLLLIDVGLSVRRLRELCALRGVDPARLRGLVVTHDHSDHGRGAGVVHRAFDCPMAMSAGTWSAVAARAGKCRDPLLVRDGMALDVAGLRVTFHATPHDAREPLCVVLERDGVRCGLFTDLGHAFDGLGELVGSLDAVFLESNYHEPMLAANPMYPEELKRRIRGRRGHLENRETGALLRDHADERLRLVVLSHLSEENNRPDVALAEVRAAAGPDLARRGLRFAVAPRHAPTPFFAIGHDT